MARMNVPGSSTVGLCIALAACTHQIAHSQSPATQITPLPEPTARYATYALGDVLMGRGPKLTRSQRKWAEHVAHSKAYNADVTRLRFTLDVRGFKTPLVIYLDKAQPGRPDRGGHVIGEACNVFFDPVIYGVSVGTGIECSGKRG